ncbi:hypothetical protein GF385_01530 [Candidatus Dependentiae bacterium]|nr:hypothetical protein [Candidatus Dependentiae bacterium]
MRKNIKSLILIGLFSTSLNSAINTNHTFLMPRPVIDDLPLEKTGRHDPLKFKNMFDHNYHLQTSFFTKHYIKGEDVGKYFGVDETNHIVVRHAASAAAVIADPNIDIWDRFLIHNYNSQEDTTDADFNLSPKQEVYALRLDFFGLLNNPIPKTFFKISAPITYIENDLHSKYITNIADDDHDYVSEFFEGKTINSGEANNLQDPLLYGKIEDKRKVVFGIADIDVHFGYRLVDNKRKHVYISGLVTIPTGNRPKGNFLFEPIYGNGNHFAIGWELDSKLRLWKKKRHKGFVEFVLKHKYTMDGREKRIIPLDLPSYPYAHYYLTGQVGQAAGTPLFPAANVLNRDVTIRPGNSVEGLLNFKFKTKRFLIDAGYNIYYKEKENISLKTAWIDDKYAIANVDYDISRGAGFEAGQEFRRINNDILDIQGAATPNQLTHKAFASLGYDFNISRHPAHIGVGGAYEFADNNYELEGYEFWIKFSSAF